MTRGAALALGFLVACSPSQGTIGAMLGQSPDGTLTVHETPEGLAAEKADLQPGDKILLIDGIDVRTLDEKGLRQALAGDVDQPVKLTVVRGEEIIRVTLKRTPAKRRRRAAPREK